MQGKNVEMVIPTCMRERERDRDRERELRSSRGFLLISNPFERYPGYPKGSRSRSQEILANHHVCVNLFSIFTFRMWMCV